MSAAPPLLQRRPLGTRSLQQTIYPSPSKQLRAISGAKRARSPDRIDVQPSALIKRARSSIEVVTPPAPTTKTRDMKDKQKRLTERAQKEAEFKRKYRKDFPDWKFYIDSDNLDSKLEQQFKAKIFRLGGSVEDFFSNSVSHLITSKPIPKPNSDINKENKENAKTVLLSPIKLLGRGVEDPACSIVAKAVEYGMKIWTPEKLESVLSRCLSNETDVSVPTRATGPSAGPQRALSRLLQNERIHGTTERDPTQRRRDYRYFSRGSIFVLVEDMSGELATIAAHEYPAIKDKESQRRPWPVLHCHPLSRNPFAPFDEKERRRYEKQQAEQKKEEAENRQKKEQQLELFKRTIVMARSLKAAGKSNMGGANLRKTLSVTNLHRRLSHPVTHNEHDGLFIDLDADDNDMESANASGYNQSGAGMNYMAASGNSVGITSTTGTTSTTGLLQRPFSTLPDKFGRHVVTSFKAVGKEKVDPNADAPLSQMGPPSKLPDRAPLLRKSKSTNTLKLPKREEGAKPGYCESCRVKFEDFSLHTISSRHRRFATNPANFVGLDAVLGRLRRKTREEVDHTNLIRSQELHFSCKYWQRWAEGQMEQPSSPEYA